MLFPRNYFLRVYRMSQFVPFLQRRVFHISLKICQLRQEDRRLVVALDPPRLFNFLLEVFLLFKERREPRVFLAGLNSQYSMISRERLVFGQCLWPFLIVLVFRGLVKGGTFISCRFASDSRCNEEGKPGYRNGASEKLVARARSAEGELSKS
jgi:hypothetical protein